MKLLKFAQQVVDSASDEGCSDDLTVTSKKAVEQLSKSLKQTAANPMGIARSVWKCPTCGSKVRLTFEELSEAGYPLCPGDDCRSQMRDMVAVEVFGQTFSIEYVSCKE